MWEPCTILNIASYNDEISNSLYVALVQELKIHSGQLLQSKTTHQIKRVGKLMQFVYFNHFVPKNTEQEIWHLKAKRACVAAEKQESSIHFSCKPVKLLASFFKHHAFTEYSQESGNAKKTIECYPGQYPHRQPNFCKRILL